MNKKYRNKLSFYGQLCLALMLLLLVGVVAMAGHIAVALVLLTVTACLMNTPQARFCAVTLSVPEILMDVLDAFKYETPELFQPGGFATDFSSSTAVLGDKITAKIAHVPLTGAYDANNGGFKAAQQDVVTLIEDVPVTLNQFRVVTIKVAWLTQLASKIALYKEAIRNYGFALGKYVVDTCLATCTAANFSNQIIVPLANTTLDSLDGAIRDQMNTQKIQNKGRYLITNTGFASKLGSDDRVRSSLFYAMLNGANGYRRWKDMAGFGFVTEYPDLFAGGNLVAFGGDARAICVATRRPDFSNVAEELGVPKVMEFHQLQDDESGIFMTGASWQESGTGDVYVSAGILFGVGSGNQGGAAHTITDDAGLRIVTA